MKNRLWFLIALVGLLVLSGALLSACGQDKSAPELEAGEDEAAAAVDNEPSEGETPDDGAGSADMVAFTDFACLECHTNQEILVELAVEEDTGESLSSGPG